MPGLAESEVFLNFGPQHPSTHGVLRVLLQLDSEYIRKAKLHYGYLHRGFEKLAEGKTYDQFLPITDRLDYLAPFFCNCAHVMAVERLMGIEVPQRAQYIRVIMMELIRISSHLLWLGAFGIDLGAITPVMYCLREREGILDLMEMVTGARLTHNYFRIGGVAQDLPPDFKERAIAYLEGEYLKKIEDYDTLLKTNRIFLGRTKGVGIVSAEEAINYGFTGPCLRSCGVAFDLRKAEPYLVYPELDFEVPVGECGDTYDRYLIRLVELRESAKLVVQALGQLPEGEVMTRDPRVLQPPKEKIFDNVETLIHYCYLASEGITPPRGEVYARVEGARGEFGVYIVSNGTNKPYRLFLRVPTFVNLTMIPQLVEGRLVADLTAILGGFDLVMGEVDK